LYFSFIFVILIHMGNLNEGNNLIHPLDTQGMEEGISYIKFFGLLAGAIILGTVVGLAITKLQGVTKTVTGTKLQKIAGIANKKTFKDTASGILQEGGVDGEGNFHLKRPGGESQNVYLTSTTVDLSAYLGKKVRVWGETFKAEKAGWLMDVGLVELLQ
jgi:hypothetical protein